MYHSITYGTKNTWDDWHLIPESRPVFNPPSPKRNQIDIPGKNGMLDLTYVLSEEPVFNNRTGSTSFIVKNGYQNWEVLYSEISNYLHGKTMTAVLEDDPSYFYKGSFAVNSWQSDKSFSRISISYDLYPFKTSINSTIDDWLWDPFNFETDVIRDYRSISVEGTITITVLVKARRVYPTITCDAPMQLVYPDGKTIQISSGVTKSLDLYFDPGSYPIIVKGTGHITIDYRDVSL